MERKPATAQDVALVVAAADLVARYASQNPMSQMQLGTMIADMHALLVDRVDNGPRARIEIAFGEAKFIAYPELSKQAEELKGQPLLATAPTANPNTTGDHPGTHRYSAEFVVAEPLVKPFLPIEESVWTNKIVCLECGKSFVTLKRHLLAVHKETDTDYRKKFGLSANYPMISDDFEGDRRLLMKKKGKFKPLTKADREARSAK
jgi:predicted transcriptional regulator